MGDTIKFSISIPTDQGFIGRSCNNPNCGKYFKIHQDFIKPEMFCPYCGIKFSNDDLWTEGQLTYLSKVALEKAKEYMSKEINKTFRQLAKESSSSNFFKFEYKPYKYKARTSIPSYRERKVDSELICPDCNVTFQVFGIFGYCPGCHTENLKIYDANFAIIKQEISNSSNPQRALRHAYSDLVSTFEIFCRKKASSFTDKKTNFQNIPSTRKFFKKHLNIDIYSKIDENDKRLIKRIFLKRHLYEHNDGIVNEKYVKQIQEDSHLLRKKAKLSLDELSSGAQVLRIILDNLKEI